MCLKRGHTPASDGQNAMTRNPPSERLISPEREVLPSSSSSLIDDCIVCTDCTTHDKYLELLNENSELRIENSELRRQVGFWKAMHGKAADARDELKIKMAESEAKIKLRERQLFGKKSEKGGKKSESNGSKPKKRPRGQQRGGKGHGRRDHSHLPAKEEESDLPEDERCCSNCGLPFDLFPDTEDSEILEVEVRAHRRIIRRKKYKPACYCGCNPGIVTAPPAPRLIPKGIHGVSIWVSVLLDKFQFMRPTYRLLEDWNTIDLGLSQGTLTGGLRTIAPVFEPIYEAIIEKNLESELWHADETRWLVFTTVEGKVGHRWYLWVFCTKETVVFKLDPTRSAKVPKGHFGETTEGILVVDRYSAYKAMVKSINIILAFCWAHVRRDFLGVANDWSLQEEWAMEWVEAIGNLYHLNKKRLEVLDEPEEFEKRDLELRDAVDEMERKRESELAEENIHPARKKVLVSKREHWDGLTVFVDHPEVPMDNNTAESHIRGPVGGRKNYYGSGAIWSGCLAAMLFSFFQTLGLWNINSRLWLTDYLNACAANGGKAPDDIQDFLPWNMSPEKRKRLSLKIPINDSS